MPSHRHLTSVPVSTAIRAPPVVALNRNPPRRAGSTRCQTAPLEVDRSSSQSALSERPGRWNGRVSERRQPLPSVPAVSAFIEFCVGMMTGEVEKGGCRELRADPQLYATAAYGLSQAEMFMPVEKKGTFGWGPYKDAPYKLQSIQQYATALRVWLKEELRRWPDAGVANPMYDGWVASVMNYVQKELPSARMEERLPPALTTGVFNENKYIKRTHQTRGGRRTGSPPARAGSCKDDQGHRGTGAGSASRHGAGLGRVHQEGLVPV